EIVDDPGCRREAAVRLLDRVELREPPSRSADCPRPDPENGIDISRSTKDGRRSGTLPAVESFGVKNSERCLPDARAVRFPECFIPRKVYGKLPLGFEQILVGDIDERPSSRMAVEYPVLQPDKHEETILPPEDVLQNPGVGIASAPAQIR